MTATNSDATQNNRAEVSDAVQDGIWPVKLTLRDTKVFADEGQRIFTTATGYGYEKREYIRADALSTSHPEPSAVQVPYVVKLYWDAFHGHVDAYGGMTSEESARRHAGGCVERAIFEAGEPSALSQSQPAPQLLQRQPTDGFRADRFPDCDKYRGHAWHTPTGRDFVICAHCGVRKSDLYETRAEFLRSQFAQPAPQPDAITDETGTWSDGGKSWDPAPEPDAKASGVEGIKAGDVVCVLRCRNANGDEVQNKPFSAGDTFTVGKVEPGRRMYPCAVVFPEGETSEFWREDDLEVVSTPPTEAGVEEPMTYKPVAMPSGRVKMIPDKRYPWVHISDHNTIVERLHMVLTARRRRLDRWIADGVDAINRADQAEAALTTERERIARLREALEGGWLPGATMPNDDTIVEVRRVEEPVRWNAARFRREAVVDVVEWRPAALRELKGGE